MSAPVAQFYAAQGKCYTVCAEDAPEAVFEKVQDILDRYLKAHEEAVKKPMPSGALPGDPFAAESPGTIPSDRPTATETPLEITKVATEASSTDAPSEDVQEAAPLSAETETEAAQPLAAEKPTQSSVVFILGGPGSGKGTQCERIVEEYGYRHISVGDLLRAEVESGSQLGQECDALMKEGQLVPVSITLDLLKAAITTGDAESYLIDGFPRSTEQASLFEKEVAICDCVLFFECSEEVMLERMMERSKNSGRADDNPETMKKRLETFKEVSSLVAEFYSRQGKCHVIPAERDPSEIYTDVKAILDDLKEKRSPDRCESEREEAEVKLPTVWILDDDNEAVEGLKTALEALGWSCRTSPVNDALDFKDFKDVKIIVWNPSNNAEAVLHGLKGAVETGLTVLPDLSFYTAAKEKDFVKKISDGASAEEGQSFIVRSTFETPVEIEVQSTGNEDASTRCLSPDDPEMASIVKQLTTVDIPKIKEICGCGLPPAWSAQYLVVGEEEERQYVFSGLECLPMRLFSRQQSVEAVAKGIVEAKP